MQMALAHVHVYRSLVVLLHALANAPCPEATAMFQCIHAQVQADTRWSTVSSNVLRQVPHVDAAGRQEAGHGEDGRMRVEEGEVRLGLQQRELAAVERANGANVLPVALKQVRLHAQAQGVGSCTACENLPAT